MIHRRRKPEPTKVNHDRWLVSYADFITLLFGFFVVMYSVSQVNESQYKQLSETLGAAFKSHSGVQQQPAETADDNLAEMTELRDRVKGALAELIKTGQVEVRASDEWVEIAVDAALLFDSGSATPSPAAQQIFSQVGQLLAPYDNAVDVAGHTDNLPIANSQFSNNWELSAARATRVVAMLSDSGIAPQRLSATGYGEFQPLADNSTEAGRAANRRVVLLVARHRAEPASAAAPVLADELSAQQGGNQTPPVPADNPLDIGQVEAIAEPQAVAPESQQRAPLEPVILEDGTLLFTSDPDLPRRRD